MPLHRDTFAALSGSTCRKVLDVLCRGPQSVSEIHVRLKFSTRANVSQALARLLKADLVSLRSQGRNHIYQLRPGPLRELARYFTALARDARHR